MQNKYIVIIGGFKLPDGNASAQRAIENCHLIKSIGYDPVLLGKHMNGLLEENFDGFKSFSIFQPDRNIPKCDYTKKCDSVCFVLEKLGVQNVKAIIAYNYPPVGLNKIIKYSKNNNIKVILDSTEWYGFEGKGLIRNLIRYFATQYRMRYLAIKAKNIICASSYLSKFYNNLNTTLLPFSINQESSKWKYFQISKPNSPRIFLYAGSPGVGMSKDLIHLMVDSFYRLKKSNQSFKFVIVGITEKQFLDFFPTYLEKLTYLVNNIKFMGRVSHAETLNLVNNADFSLLLRPYNRVSNIGFSTKIVESMSLGTPTIANVTSDIDKYVLDGNNGYIIRSLNIDDIEKKIYEAINVSDEKLEILSSNCINKNPFNIENYKNSMSKFLKQLR